MNKKVFFIIFGIILVLLGLVLIYFNRAPIPSLLMVAGYIFISIGLIPSKEEKDDKKKKD